LKRNIWFGLEGMTQVVEQLPSRHEVLSSNPLPPKKKEKKYVVILGILSKGYLFFLLSCKHWKQSRFLFF
jgi:hypothetical protein